MNSAASDPLAHVSHFLDTLGTIFSVPRQWYPERILPVLDPIFVKTAGCTSWTLR